MGAHVKYVDATLVDEEALKQALDDDEALAQGQDDGVDPSAPSLPNGKYGILRQEDESEEKHIDEE